MNLVHIRDRNAEDGHRIDFFFTCSKWMGVVENVEPHKCNELVWIPPNELANDIVPYIKDVIQHVEKGVLYSQENWA